MGEGLKKLQEVRKMWFEEVYSGWDKRKLTREKAVDNFHY
jgi:hypothetical protein